MNRIAFLCHPYHRGGVTRWMADFAVYYSNNGYETYFVTIEPSEEFYSGKGKETLIKLIKSQPNKVKLVTTKAGQEFEFGAPEYREFFYKQLLSENVPISTPIILSDDASIWKSAWEMRATYPLVGVLHADEGHYYKLAAQYKNDIDLYTSVSNRVTTKTLKETQEIGSEKMFTIPCGIALPSARTSFFNHSPTRLIYVGRLNHYQKRIKDLALLGNELKKEGINFELNVVGDGDADKNDLVKLIKDLGLEQNISLKGWQSQSEVYSMLTESDILLLPSNFEGMPISMMEALASGCGFLGTRVSGVEDLESDELANDCFRIYDVGKVDDGAKKLIQLISVPAEKRASAARELALNYFSMEMCFNSYNKAIDHIQPRKYKATPVTIPSMTFVKSRFRAMLRIAKLSFNKG